MKRLHAILLAMLLVLGASAKTEKTFSSVLSKYLSANNTVLNANGLTTSEMKEVTYNSFKGKHDNADFQKALDKYFAERYSSDIIEALVPYYQESLTISQLDSLIAFASAEDIHRAKAGLARCDDAVYRDSLVDETLKAIAEKTGKKVKKKNKKKFVSDCPEDYRAVLAEYLSVSGKEKLAEDYVNAIYNTVSIDDLKAYTAYLGSYCLSVNDEVEKDIAEDIYSVQGDCISRFQQWTYKAYPSLFTKKQNPPKKERKKRNRRGKKNKNKDKEQQQKPEEEIILDGGFIM